MNRVSRRSLLRGAAASAGALALLPVMSRLTRAGGSQAPVRFLFIVEGNCYYPVTVLDPSTLQAINASGASPPVDLTKLPAGTWYQQYRHQAPLIVPSTDFANTIALPAIASQGLASKTAVLFGLSSRITGGGHSAFHGVLSSTRTVGGAPGGITIDAYLGGKAPVRQNTPFDVIRLGTVANNPVTRLSYATCAFGPGSAAPAITDPVAAFNTLFGIVGTPAQALAFQQRSQLLAYAQQDVTGALPGLGTNAAEVAKLTTYGSAIKTLSDRQARLESMAAQLAAAKPLSPDANPAYPQLATDCMQRFEAQLTLAVAAFKAQLTNVAVLQSGTGGDFGALTYPNAPVMQTTPDLTTTMRHPLHHMYANTPAASQTIHDMSRFQFDAVAAAAADLMSTPDPAGGGSMLDNTVIVFIGDNGEQHHSTASEFPVVLIGGANAGLKTGGRTIVYPGVDSGGANHRQVSNLWNTLGHLAGQNLTTFGGEGPLRVAPGPLAELMS